MPQMSFDDLPHIIAEEAYHILEEEQPGSVAAITGLVEAGESPDAIYNAVLRMSHGNVMLAGMFSQAATYIKNR